MSSLKDLLQNADWKAEKHVPVIEALEEIKKGDSLKVTVTVGKEIAHPNKTEHHIRWISIFFQPDGEKFPCQIARVEFCAHGESTQGPDTSSIYTGYEVSVALKTEKPGMIYASSYCNIHGLWESTKYIKIT
ncbi:MAG: class II SORL domain-containing protein [Candidatus Omnitrophota bacterium]